MLLSFPNEWTPRILFAAGEQGGWYDPSDITTLWQDDARTTPVTATGQTVGAIDDKSGNGNHATQGNVVRRPLYQIDSTGRPYLNFDGTDDCLFTASFDGLSTGVFASAGILKGTVAYTTRRVLLEYGPTTSTVGSWSLFSEGSAADSMGGRSRGATSDRETLAGAGTITGGSLYVLSGYHSTAAPRVRLRSQGVTLATLTSIQGSANYGPQPLFIGSRNNNSLRARIDFYGGVVQFATSTSDAGIELAERWMARKTGVAF